MRRSFAASHSRYNPGVNDQDLTTVQQIDDQLRALRYERERLALMEGMVRNIMTIDDRIKRLEDHRAELVTRSAKGKGPSSPEGG